LNKTKNQLNDRFKEVQAELDSLHDEKNKLLKLLPPDCTSEEKVKTKVKQLEYQI